MKEEAPLFRAGRMSHREIYNVYVRWSGLTADDGDAIFSMKRHNTKGEVLIAACDADILGKSFEDGDLQIVVREGFYGGEIVDRKTLERFMGDATIVNLIGNNVVDLALELGIVEDDCIIRVGKVPHAQVFRLM